MIITCEECGTPMELLVEELKVICPNCGRWEELTEEEAEDYDEYVGDSVPYGCRACGGPYPNCIASCNVFDE